MPEASSLREPREARAAARAALHTARRALDAARAALARARRRGNAAEIAKQEEQIRALEQKRAQVDAEIEARSREIERLREAVLVDPKTTGIEPLPATVPLVLLPVRIETRFATNEGRVVELQIRVFPDDIHVDSHEPELTDAEVEAGRSYWNAFWRAGPATDRRDGAWRRLAETVGLERAAWVARATQPNNSEPQLEEPLPPDAALPTAPDFPEPPRKEGDWTRASVASALPDRWIAVGFRGVERLFVRAGSRIPEPLAVGPDPSAERLQGTDLFVDEASDWTIDFARAVASGMGIRVPAEAELNLDAGVDLLLVVGVKGSAAPDEGAELVTRLLEAQRYGEGLAFLERGIPTNNTEAERAGWQDAMLPSVAATATAAHAIVPGDGTHAGSWAAALGLSTEQARRAFDGADGAAGSDGSRAMRAALWPATWGYLLQHMAGAEVRPHIAAVRRHLLDWVSGGGHHAALRIGNQPYGLIVHTDLEGFDPGEASLLGLLALLRKLRDRHWAPAVDRAPHIGRSADEDQDLLAVLGQCATSPSYAVRPGIGPDFAANLSAWLDAGSAPTWSIAHAAVARTPTIAALELGNVGALDLAFASTTSDEVPALVQEGEHDPQQAPNPNYIRWLAETSHGAIRREVFPGPAPRTLLYMLLRHAALQDTAREATNLLTAAIPELAALRLDPEMIDMREEAGARPPIVGLPRGADLTLARVTDVPVAGVTGGEPLGAYLSARRSSGAPSLAAFREFWDALDRIASMSVAQLELFLRETLDLSSHRLDAWLLSFGAKLLAARRAQSAPSGVLVGGYGWVEGLEPRTASRSDGFVHTPSVAHAGLAAVLRSGYLSHRDAGHGAAFAVDLSSERVRLAEWLLDSVRAGQSPGAALGYRLERALHEQHPGLELDVFIHALRRRAPLVAGKLEATVEPFEAVAARNVVDGLALVRMWQSGLLRFEPPVADLPAPGSAEHDAIVAELEALAAVIDAAGDALLAESVFQLGNPGRAAATLEAIAGGDVPPPELQFAQTPRRGLGVVHRVVVAVPASSVPAAPWPADATQVRAVADPDLEAWASGILGSPSRYRYRLRYLDPASDSVVAAEERSLTALRISALDAVFLVDGDDLGATELAQLVRHQASVARLSGTENARVEIELDAGDSIGFAELDEVARAVRKVLRDARPISGSDLTALGEPSVTGIDSAELAARSAAVTSRLAALESQLTTLLADPGASLDALRAVLLALHAFGFRDTVPSSPSGSGASERAALTAQARALASALASRRRALDEIVADFDATNASQAEIAEHARAGARAAIGGTLPILPRFAAANAAELAQTLGEQSALTRADGHAAVTWLQRNARVRERIADVNDLLLYDAAINARDFPLRVAQLPFRSGSVWAALEGQPDLERDANRLSLVLVGPSNLDVHAALAGFVVDEWPETIPASSNTTALAFHYDQPGARAPNALLLAVAPDASKPWTLDTIVKIVRDTLQLAKLRAVDGDALRGLGQLLPALLFASNSELDTIAMPLHRFTRLRTGEED